MLCGNSDENGNAIRDYDTAKRIRRRVTLQQKQFKDYSICQPVITQYFVSYKSEIWA